MAYQNTILSNTDPIINMVRSASIVLTQRPADEIRRALNDHAFPRIRLRLLSATSTYVNGEGTGKNEGVNLWFTDLTDLSDPLAQDAVNTEIDNFIQGNPLVKDGIYSVAARLAASIMTSGMAAQVKPQADYAIDLEKTAMADLEKLIRTPFFTGAVTSAKETKLKERAIPRIYIAADVNDDETTYNATENSGQVYPGSLVPGRAQLMIGYQLTDVVTYDFPAGTTPAQILAGLTQAWRLVQTGRLPGEQLNLVLAPDEGRPAVGVRPVQYYNYPGPVATVLRSPIVRTNLGFLQITPYVYDKAVDYINVEMKLYHETVVNSGIFDLPGTPGVLYGIEPLYSALTSAGPHSIIIDPTTGEKAATTATTAEEKNKRYSDTFYFGIAEPGEPAEAWATISGTVGVGNQFDVTVDGVTYSYTTIGGDTQASVVSSLAGLITTGAAFTANPGVSDPSTLYVFSLASNDSQNGVPFGVATTAPSATFLTGFSQLDNGRNDNTLTNSGVIRYRFQEMIDPLNPVPTSVAPTLNDRTRTVAVSRGEDILDVVVRIANDMASFSKTSRCLGAVRSPTYFKIQGTAFNAPGLTIVPYIRDTEHYKVVCDILEVPAGTLFSVLPNELLPQPSVYMFDDRPKSVWVEAKIGNASGGGSRSKTPSITTTDQGSTTVVGPQIASWLTKANQDITRLRNLP